MNDEQIARHIVRRLYSNCAWGNKHLLINRLKSWLPKHLRGQVNEIVKDLVRKEILVVYGRTKHGLALHLNIKKKAEIENYYL